MHFKLISFFVFILLSTTAKKCGRVKAKKNISISNYIIDGYMNKISFNPGDTAHIFINGAETYTNAKWYLYTPNYEIADSVTVNLSPQNIPSNNTSPWKNGYAYSKTFDYIIPHNLKSGMYNWENKIFFIVKSASKNADITVIYPSNTEAAYNNAGGKSLYNYSSTNNQMSEEVSFQRPLVTLTQKKFSDGFMRWINSLSNYSVQMICDQDMDDYSEIENSKIIVVIGHSEYWTRTARLNFDQFVNSGKDAILLAGNSMWWQVRYSSDKTKLICYKGLSDTISNPMLKTINWPDTSLHYPVLSSIGVDYLHGAISNTSFGSWNGYKILLPNSPLLAGTALNADDILSCKTQEYDGTLFSGFDSKNNPIPDTSTLGFCKMEMIGYDWGENTMTASQKGYGTFIAFKKNPSSGNVINTSSNQWCWNNNGITKEGGFGAEDAGKIKQITINMFNLLLSHSNIYSTPANTSCFSPALFLSFGEGKFEVFPNPTTGLVDLRFTPKTSSWAAIGEIKIDVCNTIGKTVYRKILYSLYTEIDLSSLPKGIYFIKVTSDDGIEVHKFVKQ